MFSLKSFLTCHRAASGPSKDDDLSSLIFVAEVLVRKPLPSSLELVTVLLDVLSAVVNLSAGVDVGYAEQLLMTAIEYAAAGVKVSSLLKYSFPSQQFFRSSQICLPRAFIWMFL